MELSIEKLRSPRRRLSSSSIFLDQGSSASSTPFASAPSSPRYYAYYSAPSSPPRDSSQDHSLGIPFAWEERPGTPKGSHSPSPSTELEREAKNSVDHLAAMGLGFHFSAPVSPQREFDFMNQPRDNLLDDFEFSSARMSDADSVVSHADELFFQGQILPLKLPNRLHHHHKSLSLSLQLQDFSPRTSDSFRPAPSSSFGEQLPSPKLVLKSPPRLSSPPAPRSRSKSPSKLGRAGSAEKNSSAVKSLRELLHLNTRRINGSESLRSSGIDGKDGGSLRSSGTESAESSRNGSLRSSGSDSRSSSGSTSQRFSSSRSSSVSSAGGGVRSPRSSRRVSPVPSRELTDRGFSGGSVAYLGRLFGKSKIGM